MSSATAHRLYLVTHALTQVEQTAEASHWRLSPAGEQQAHTLAVQPFWAEVTRIVLSQEAKTRLTIEPLLAQRKVPIHVDGRFNELYRPGWVENYGARVRQALAQPDQPAGEWEAATVALARFQAGIADLCQRFPGETLALVGHGLTFSLYRAALLGRATVDYTAWQQLSFAAVALVDPVAHVLLQDFTPIAGQTPRG
ncbi:MAG: histidine phosphatase family protein [Caldilineaceae bacterium]